MIESSHRSTTARACKCGQQPLHISTHRSHELRCYPCSMTTGKFATVAHAERQWEAFVLARLLERIKRRASGK